MSSSRIAGKVVSYRLLYTASEVSDDKLDKCGEYLATAYNERSTEVKALADNYVVDESNHIMWRAYFLAQVAAAPHMYPLIEGRPRKSQGGSRLYQWVGRRLGVSALEAEHLLDDAAKVIEKRW